jgi:mRNA interferase RelE/StbE
MARYRVLLSRKADKFLGEVNRELGLKVMKEISDLQNFPFLTMHHDLAKLKGRENYYRIRVGDLRVIFKIDKSSRTIHIEKIGQREAVYE